MNSKTHQSRDHKDWFRYWKDHLKTQTPLLTTKEFREKNLDQKNWKTRLSTDDLWIKKSFLSEFSEGDSSLSEDKGSIRGRVLSARSVLSESEVLQKSRRIYLNLISLAIFESSQKIGLYSPIKNEVRTDSIFSHALRSGKEIFFPKVQGTTLSFRKVEDPMELTPGKFGVLEPGSDAATIAADELDLIVLPGAAFDTSGSRLGYGKGYYDRFLERVSLSKRIGITYKFQLQKNIPTRAHDKKVGVIVHEQGIVFCSSKLGGN